MSCDEMKILISGMIDGELEPNEKKTISDHLTSCAGCRDEFGKLNKLNEVTDDMKYFDLPDRLLAGYWHGIYNKIERGIGWMFLSIGAIILLIYGGWILFEKFFNDPTISLTAKIGIGAAIIGLIILLVSIIRERIFSKKHDRYDEVEI